MSLDIEALYAAEYVHLCRYVRKRLPDHGLDAASDLASEVFRHAWEKRHQYRPRPGAKPSSWLYRIARNLLIDSYRHHGRISFFPLWDMRGFVTHVGTDEHCERLDAQADVARVLSAYRTGNPRYAPDKQLAVIRARYWEGGTDADVAERLGLSWPSVKKLRARALANLRKLLEAA